LGTPRGFWGDSPRLGADLRDLQWFSSPPRAYQVTVRVLASSTGDAFPFMGVGRRTNAPVAFLRRVPGLAPPLPPGRANLPGGVSAGPAPRWGWPRPLPGD